MYEILFQYGPIAIKTFNLLLAVAFLVGIIFLVRFIRLKKLKLAFFVENLILFLIIPLIGGRLFYIFEHLALFKQNPLQALFIWDLGFSVFGLFYTAIGTLYVLSKREQEDFWGWVDAFTLTSLVGLFFIHIGTFLNGTHYGIPTDLPWGIAFDTYNIPFTTPIHPTQIYSALMTFVILGISMRYVKKTHLTGVVGTLSIMLYSLSAFGIDFLHGYPSMYTKVNHLIIASLAFVFYILCSHKKLLKK